MIWVAILFLPILIDGHKFTADNHKIIRGQIQYQVSLRRIGNKEHFCSGSILNENYILTAAHCVEDLNKVLVVAGQINLDITVDSISSYSKKIFIYPEYSMLGFKNDIAIIELEKPFDLNHPNISKVIISPDVIKYDNKLCTVCGWGNIGSGLLSETNVTIVSKDICDKQYGERDDTFCATLKEGKQTLNAFEGDSGGPLVCDGLQVGIASFGYEYSSPLVPGAYTYAAKYNGWILKITAGESYISYIIVIALTTIVCVYLILQICKLY